MPLYNPPIIIQDEGADQGPVNTVNFTGTAVAATVSGSTATVAVTGGSGSPGGTTGQVQYNNAGAFAGASKLTVESTGSLVVGNTTTIPTAPAYLGGVVLFTELVKNYERLCMYRPGLNYAPIQPCLSDNKVGFFTANGNSTTVSAIGMGATVTGTATARTVAVTNVATQSRRIGYVSSTTAGTSAGIRNGALQFTVGGALNRGGFIYKARFFVSTANATNRWFVGLIGSAAVIGNVNPSTLTNVIGFGCDAGGANVNLIQNDTTVGALLTDAGAGFPAQTINIPYEVTIISTPVTSKISTRLLRLDNGATYDDQISTRRPADTQLLDLQIWINNGTTAAATSIDVISQYIETDV
jgi:hypothetical protein